MTFQHMLKPLYRVLKHEIVSFDSSFIPNQNNSIKTKATTAQKLNRFRNINDFEDIVLRSSVIYFNQMTLK